MRNYLNMRVFVPIPSHSLSTVWRPSTIAMLLYSILVVELAREICLGVA